MGTRMLTGSGIPCHETSEVRKRTAVLNVGAILA